MVVLKGTFDKMLGADGSVFSKMFPITPSMLLYSIYNVDTHLDNVAIPKVYVLASCLYFGSIFNLFF